jgi:hypothetical protein
VITQAWLNAWEHVIPFLAFPAEVRRVIYTTDESVKCSRVDLGSFLGEGLVAAGTGRAADRLVWRRSAGSGRCGVDFGRDRGVVCSRRLSAGVRL